MTFKWDILQDLCHPWMDVKKGEEFWEILQMAPLVIAAPGSERDLKKWKKVLRKTFQIIWASSQCSIDPRNTTWPSTPQLTSAIASVGGLRPQLYTMLVVLKITRSLYIETHLQLRCPDFLSVSGLAFRIAARYITLEPTTKSLFLNLDVFKGSLISCFLKIWIEIDDFRIGAKSCFWIQSGVQINKVRSECETNFSFFFEKHFATGVPATSSNPLLLTFGQSCQRSGNLQLSSLCQQNCTNHLRSLEDSAWNDLDLGDDWISEGGTHFLQGLPK